MARKCTLCSHPNKAEIEAQILDNVPNRDIERRHGIGRNAIANHKKKHMTFVAAAVQADPRVEKATEHAVTATLDNLSTTDQFRARFSEMRRKIDTILEYAEQENNVNQQIAAIREARGLMDLEARVILQILGMKNDNQPLEVRWIEE